jgi:hypothetical protein
MKYIYRLVFPRQTATYQGMIDRTPEIATVTYLHVVHVLTSHVLAKRASRVDYSVLPRESLIAFRLSHHKCSITVVIDQTIVE